ncbi:TIM-barrel domain-containing protein [Enterococcus diestrammenae]|uniref:glycoside hydrolase family 31 protein n=1 Tax=Enterococcus diestrammenae TaxID=1155073 RepID=UPI001F96C663|nr:TIM-barrel domain-containing protein [Enterococcus diestrammenae]HIX71010.1 glycoside hydrolase family 31 protein [Candidatus Enterococcus stercoravium]
MAVFTNGKTYLEFQNNNERVRIIPWGANSFRVVATPNGPVDLTSAALLEQPAITDEVTITIRENEATIQSGNIKAVVNSEGWSNVFGRISFYDGAGKLLLAEADGGGALLKKPRYFRSQIGGDYRLTATFAANDGEKIYGMGQYQQDILDLKGCNLELAHRNSQASVPFYVSNKGYGFLWHNPAVGTVTFGANTTEWRADSTKQLDYWITAGTTPAAIEEQYSAVTGRVPMMPEYGLGFWQCKLRYVNQDEVLEVAREYHRRGVKVDVLVIDYYHWPRCGDYRFDEHFFPNVKEMVAECRSYGIELMVSIWPQIDVRSENFQEMKERGLLVQTAHGMDVQMIFHGNNVFYDATNPETRKYIWQKVKANYREQGIRLFWLDEAEPEFGTYDYDTYRYYAGSVLQQGNIYPREYVRGFHEGEAEDFGENTVKLVRCAWAGSQRYGALVWSGDIHSTYQDFKNQVVAGLQMGLAGIPWWTTDIGGFHGGDVRTDEFKELLIRWFQYGAFSPVMRIHGSRTPHREIFKADGEPTEQSGAANEIWSYGEENYQIMKKFIDVREAMRDYNRDLMTQAHEKGAPVLRGMFYEFPEDATTWDLKDQYMFGGDVLVAPVMVAGATTRRVYLPQGAQWTDARDGKVYQGGQWLDSKAAIETLPIFLRDGRQEYLVGMI